MQSIVPTSTRTHEHTSTRAHEHTSTRAHDTQPIPPQKNLTIRGNTSPATAQKYVTKTPRCASLPRHTATQAPTVSSIIPAAHTKKGRALPAAPQKTPHPTPPRQTHEDMPNTTNTATERARDAGPSEQPLGGFATIDPRHAGDTPQRSAYGSNSPKPPTNTSHNTTTNRRRQAEHDQHCHIKDPPAHRRATTPPSTQPPRHTTTQAPTVSSIIPAAHTKKGRALPAAPQKTPHPTPPRQTHEDMPNTTNTATERARDAGPSEQPLGGFATIDPRHAGDTPQRSAYGSNSPQATNKNKPHHPDKQTKHVEDGQHCHLKSTRRRPSRATTRGVLRP